jgi:hypothetical protein
MAMRYCRHTDILQTFSAVTLASGTASTDPNYDLTALSDFDLSKPLKMADTTAVRVTWDHGSATRMDGFSLPKHNLDASLAVKIQRNATNSWGTPSQDVAVTISADRPGNPGHSRSPWVDLSAAAGYDVAGFRYTSLYVPTNGTAPKLKAFLISQFRTFSHGVLASALVTTHRRGYIPAITTAFGVKTYYNQNVVQRGVRGTVQASPTDWQALQDLADDCGGCVDPFFFVLDDSVTDDGGLMVRMSEEMAANLEASYIVPTVRPVTFDFEEVSRGLPY